LTHTFLVLVTVGLGHGVYRKLYTVIGVNAQKRLRTTDLGCHCKILGCNFDTQKRLKKHWYYAKISGSGVPCDIEVELRVCFSLTGPAVHSTLDTLSWFSVVLTCCDRGTRHYSFTLGLCWAKWRQFFAAKKKALLNWSI